MHWGEGVLKAERIETRAQNLQQQNDNVLQHLSLLSAVLTGSFLTEI
jgi:hypothetical protein